MHLPKNPSETVSKSSVSRIYTLVATMALMINSCISTQHTQQTDQPLQKNETSEGDIDSREYCTLVGTTAQIQAGIEFMTELRSLGAIKRFVEEEMKKENITGEVTVKACRPTKNMEGTCTYVTIHVDGVGTTEIYSRDPAIAYEICNQIKINDEIYYPGIQF